jgi:MFS family permease
MSSVIANRQTEERHMGAVATPAPGSQRAPASSWYALAVLVLVAVLGAVDKIIFVLLTEPVRHALSLSDTQIGLLQGAGMVLFASLATLPLAWLSDRYDRRWVLAACIVFWSLATALRGASGSFLVLFVATSGLGVGEQGVGPIVNSMMPDMFPRTQRVLANALFTVSSILGSALGSMLGGAIVKLTEAARHLLPAALQALETWRLVFMATALAGLPVALLVMSMRRVRRLTPAERTAAPQATGSTPGISFADYLRAHWGALAGMVLGIGLGTISVSGIGGWIPILPARRFGVGAAELGQHVGLAFLVGTLVGAVVGATAMRVAQRLVGPAATLRLLRYANLCVALFSVPLLFVRSANDIYALLALLVVPLISTLVILPNLLQDVCPAHLRARVISTLALASLPFAIVGPLLMGAVSDALKASPDGLAQAIVGVALVFGIGGALVLRINEKPFLRLLDSVRAP